MPVDLIHKEYKVRFLPEKGMNFVSFKKGDIEAIDQSTQGLFDERFAGLGAMIGPHFYHRKVIPSLKLDEKLFPYAKHAEDPFSHGIGRYAPWDVEKSDGSSLSALLKGSHKWQGFALKDLEGQDFKIAYDAHLSDEGLHIDLSVVSDTESIVGLHTYYALAGGRGRVTANVQKEYNDGGEFKPIPSTWNYQDQQLIYELNQETDFGFLPSPNSFEGDVVLETGSHKLRVRYWSDNDENSWQLWHPSGSSFVCIEPLSAKNSRRCRLSVSRIKILISIL
ncbi:MAG: hypothetical protein S4CHLAM45_10370 [Chlamydiales bacterium]|nr:hypothetical protein [Chlamydiales bacterium]MCH9619531.1 hypothetical protein [Chlamydiales bacterium]MCH9623137.1 hypothetical protein [Chlamydiales bacterium]